MPIIDADGLFDGERFDQCSDQARALWPHFWCASNSFGRIEVNHHKIVARAFHRWKQAPSEETVMGCMAEYQKAHLLFVYEIDGQIWGQWDTQKKYLPNYQSNSDKRSPGPDPEEFAKWKAEYGEFKSVKLRRKQGLINLSEKFPKNLVTPVEKVSGEIPEEFQHGVGVGVGVGSIGVGVGIRAREDLKIPVGEIVQGCFERHEKRNSRETKDLIVPMVMGMDLDFSEMSTRHALVVEHWQGRWDYNPETFLAWVRNGMPVPSPREKISAGAEVRRESLTSAVIISSMGVRK